MSQTPQMEARFSLRSDSLSQSMFVPAEGDTAGSMWFNPNSLTLTLTVSHNNVWYRVDLSNGLPVSVSRT